jgi:hypothetical protein
MSSLHPEAFARCAALHPLRRRPWGRSVFDHFLALCFAQLTNRGSLRDLASCLNARPAMKYHLGFRGRLTRTNLAYANARRDWRVFAAVAQGHMRRARKLCWFKLKFYFEVCLVSFPRVAGGSHQFIPRFPKAGHW